MKMATMEIIATTYAKQLVKHQTYGADFNGFFISVVFYDIGCWIYTAFIIFYWS